MLTMTFLASLAGIALVWHHWRRQRRRAALAANREALIHYLTTNGG